MEDNDIISFVYKRLNDCQRQRLKDDERAIIATFILKNFNTTLLSYLSQSTEDKVYFTREHILQEECDYDLRQEMSDKIIVDALHKGYKYLEQESTSGKLVFKKIISH